MEVRHQTPIPLKSRRASVKSGRISKQVDSSTVLACNHCRAKKVKCIVKAESCQRCTKLKIQCSWPSGDQRKVPSSKSHIQELYQRIAYLESFFAAATAANSQNSSSSGSDSLEGPADWRPPLAAGSPLTVPPEENDNIIARLCGRQWKLNSDGDGEYKFFGPTSSLHLTESVSSSLLGAYRRNGVTEDTTFGGRIDLSTQEHLLDVYWRHQPTVLQVFDREDFLEGMRSGRSKYFSKALLCTVFACAARISDRPDIRALVIPSHENLEDEQPFLMAMASNLLDEELKKPQVTTVQALLLFSVIHCAFSNDTKGWLLVGNACRIAVDLGLHRNTKELASTNLAPRDVRVRRVTYLGCLVFDRLWALYLGRPFCLQSGVTEVEDDAMMHYETPWEMRIAESWARLLVTVGRICEALNGENYSDDALHALDTQLQNWHDHLQPDIHYFQGAHPSVLLMHMQFYSSKMILHRATANFGSTRTQSGAQSNRSQQICIANARNVATALQDYRLAYGEATTMSGVALHIIATASTILIAGIAERRSEDVSDLCLALKTCVRSLREMEKTYLVARRVRRIIRLVMSLCHLDVDHIDSQQDASNSTDASAQQPPDTFSIDTKFTTDASAFQSQDGMMELSNTPWWNILCPDDSPRGHAQFDVMYNLDF